MSNLSNKSKRYRNFCLVTYLDLSTVSSVLSAHQHQIRACSWIEHDKDTNDDGTPKETHVHVVIALNNNTTVNAIKNWFNGYVDDKGLPINTLVQNCNCLSSQFDYLIHKNDINKYQYDKSLRWGWNFEYFIDTTLQDTDTLTLAFMDICNGVPLSILVQKYGRDFIIHYRHLKTLYCDMLLQERNVNPFEQDERFNNINDEKF